MKIKYVILAIFTFFSATFVFAENDNAEAYTLSGAEAVMERDSLRVLHGYNMDEKMPMASTTKILTAITVIENYDLSKEITVPKETVGVEGSSVYLKAGDRYTVNDLLYGLMLRSGNDCAETLAVTLSGSKENFVAKMNEFAAYCGAENSNFTNPHGLPDENHYTTARDLCKIACKAMQNSKFKEIVSSKSYTATELNSGTKTLWVNKNKLLRSYDGATGIKTGFTVKAGRCLVSSAERNGMEVVCVVLNSPQMFERSTELLDAAYNNYKLIKVVDSEKFDYTVFSEDKTSLVNLRIKEDFYYPVKEGENVSAEIDIPKNITLPVNDDEEIGSIKIYCEKRLIFSEKIYTLII